MINERIFGSYKDFGIRYVPGWKSQDEKYEFAILHLVLKGMLIGSPNETCLLGTWLMNVGALLKTIKTNAESLYHKEFLNRTDNEIFKMIYKANQLEEEYETKYSYLPVLPNRIWQSCNIGIDETIDGYLITMISIKDEIRFIWKGLRDPCPENKIGELNSFAINKETLIKRIEECLNFVEKDKVNYRMK